MQIQEILENHPHWQAVRSVLTELQDKGHQALLVGGCVRDALMGLSPQDIDIATDATPDEIQKIFPNALDIGKSFGVMILPFEGFKLEIATFRKDGPYVDGRRPKSIVFSDAKNDALRRDFTVNALFYDPLEHKILDFTDGKKDIAGKLLKAVGDAEVRFEEDKLRMLRAARFAAQLDFTVDSTTLKAIGHHATEILLTSKERITDEFQKLVKTKKIEKGFDVLFETGLFKVLFPTFEFANDRLQILTFKSSLTQSGGFLRLSMLLAWITWYEFHSDTDRLGDDLAKHHPFLLSKESQKEVEFLLNGLKDFQVQNKSAFLRLNDPLGPLLTELALLSAKLGILDNQNVTTIIDEFLSKTDDNGALPKPWVTGDVLINMGYKPSSTFSEILKEAYHLQLDGKIKGPEELQAFIKKKY